VIINPSTGQPFTDRPIEKLQRPLSHNDVALLVAYKRLMDANLWAEGLQCTECFKTHMESDGVHAVVIPDKRVSIACSCTDRMWVGSK
jgi:hypothetical protein